MFIMLQKLTNSVVCVSTAVLSGLLIGPHPVYAENTDSQDNLALNTLSLSPVLLNHPMVETGILTPAQLGNLKLDNDNAHDVVNNLNNNDANSDDIAAGTDHLNGNAAPKAQADQHSNSTKPSKKTSKHETAAASKNTSKQKTVTTSKNTTTQTTANTTQKEANNEENAKQKYYASFTLRGPKHDLLDVKQNSTSATSRNNTQSNNTQSNSNAQNMVSSNSSQQNNANTSFVKATANKTTQHTTTFVPAHAKARESSYKALYLNSDDLKSNYSLPTILWILTPQSITPLPRDKKWPKIISNNAYQTNYKTAYTVEPAGLQIGVSGYYETNIIPTKDNLQLGFFHPLINNLQIDDSNLDALLHNFKFNQGDLDVTSSEIDNFYNVILTKQGIHHLSATLSRVCHIAKNGISGKILYKIQEL